MRRLILTALLAGATPFAAAEPIAKKQLLTPPAGARHFVISSEAGKHGDIWSWSPADGQTA